MQPDLEALLKEVAAHPEVLSEALQLWRRARGQPEAFGGVQSMVRGSESGWQQLVDNLGADERARVLAWKPEEYAGLAAELAIGEAERCEAELGMDGSPASETGRTSDKENLDG